MSFDDYNEPRRTIGFKLRRYWRDLDKTVAFWRSYIVVGIVTFGYAASHVRCYYGADPVVCNNVPVSAVSFVSGLLWPLYWSWTAFGGEAILG